MTATPWPKEPLARSICRHGTLAGSRTIPSTSLAMSMPVSSPNPSLRHVSNSRCDACAVVSPSRSAIFAATTLREYAIASFHFMTPMPLRSALSIFVRPPSSRSVPTSLNFVFIVTVPSPSAATAVIILNTEPGS